MTALRTRADLGSTRCRIEIVATNAVKRSLATLTFEATVIAAVIP